MEHTILELVYQDSGGSHNVIYSNLFKFKVGERITANEYEFFYGSGYGKMFANEDNQISWNSLQVSAIDSKEEADMTEVKWCDENGTELTSPPKGLSVSISLDIYDAEEHIAHYNLTLVGNQAEAGSYYYKVITNKNKSLLTSVTVHDVKNDYH